MPGFGPRAERGREASRDDAAARVGTWAAQQAYQLGAEQQLDPQKGYTLGHDVGYAADTEHRGFVHAVMDGFEAGSQAHQELARDLHEADLASARADREASAAAEAQPELEAG